MPRRDERDADTRGFPVSSGVMAERSSRTSTELEKKIVPERITHERIIESPETRLVLDKRFEGRIKAGEVTPSVLNLEHWTCQNTGAITVTDFLNGQPAQHLYILGDGNTTLQHGTNIFLLGGVNLLLAANKVYQLLRLNGKWYQVGT
ncbi:MAG TPA: hypothetical protein VF944_11785 [Candidatus Bathyarchaeia archaeon]